MSRVAIVTGGTRGIGEAVSVGLRDAGYKVAAAYAGNDEAAKRFSGKHDIPAYKFDVSDYEQCAEGVEKIAADLGPVDILINNAATNPYFGPATGLTPEAFDKTVDVNLKGPYFMSSRAVPLMAESGGGSIVNVASIAALMSLPGQAVYAMTKAGLVSVTKSFAKEYGSKGIRVNAILPGVVETKLAAAMVEDPSVQKWLSRLPAGRAGQPEDMVAGVLYLVSDNAAYTTGTTLVMDGGATLG